MVPFYHLSLTCRRSIPHRRAHKKAVIPTPELFIERNYAVSFNNLCRKHREPDLHCINKKTGIPTLFRKKKTNKQQQQPVILFHAKLWTFPADFLGGMVADKKEEGF